MRYRTTFLILALAALFGSMASAAVVFTVNVAPPPIAVFDQSPCPGDGYIWTPGYYQYGDYGYYWVPGAGSAAGRGPALDARLLGL